jgi:Galactose oxidase-like, Early set domain/Secretion system C-terminal sorting domain/Carboxypeptidase regulatory-like domain
MKKIAAILSLIILVGLSEIKAQNTVSGILTKSMVQPVEGARLMIYNADTSLFVTTRSSLAGGFSFNNIPNGNYTLGVAKEGMDFLDTVLSITSNLSNLNFFLHPEIHPGKWNVLLNSPQTLGGTNLGILLPNGKIFYCHDTKDPFEFDPVTGQVATPTGYDTTQGCVGPLMLPDGKLLFMGGTNKQVYGPGTKKVKTYDPLSESWQIMPNLLDYRWYPTVVPLPDGRVLVTGGGGLKNPVRINTTEMYNPETGQSTWVDTIAIGNEVSPIVQLYNGKVLMTHRPPQLFNPTNDEWYLASDFAQGNRMPNGDHSDHELVLLPNDDGRVVAIGHISFLPNQLGKLVEVYDPQKDSWDFGSNFAPMRSRAKTVLMPNREIIVFGGYKEDQTHTAPVNQWGQLYLTDEYDPATDTWRRLDSLKYAREYHATAILVPDGRIITVGGEGKPGNEPKFSIIEAFSPPYLFRGVRPVITAVSGNFNLGASVQINVAFADSVTAVRLISTSSVTHFMNSGNNRFLELSFNQKGNTLSAIMPKDSVEMPNGYYMLFVMVDDVPSMAKIVKIKYQSMVGLEERLVLNRNLKIYPNPSLGRFNIEEPDDATGMLELFVYNSQGFVVYKLEKFMGNKSQPVDLSQFAMGTYIIILKSKEKLWVSKVIIER